MTEFALVMPILILLFFGIFLGAFYAWRSIASNWGVFLTGAATGSYNSPATETARAGVMWGDIRGRIVAAEHGSKQVRSEIFIRDSRPWLYGINLVEAQHGTAYFRLWRFYPGPPRPGDRE